jgi:hypothetical protein
MTHNLDGALAYERETFPLPSVSRRTGAGGALVSAVVAALVGVRPSRGTSRAAPRGSPPAHLRRDLGLPPGFERPSHWDYR